MHRIWEEKCPDASGKMAEWSIASVLKTDEGHTSGGSNPSLSAEKAAPEAAFCVKRGDAFKNYRVFRVFKAFKVIKVFKVFKVFWGYEVAFCKLLKIYTPLKKYAILFGGMECFV